MLQKLFITIAGFEWPVMFVDGILQNRDCTNTLFYTNFLDPICLRLAISKSLGYVTIAGACLYKMPVIMNIYKSKSASGLHPLSVYLESSSFIALVYYNMQKLNAISTYGDNISASTQNLMIILLIWYYGIDGKKLGASHVGLVLFAFIIFGICLSFCPAEQLGYIAIYSTVISTISKIPQVLQNFQTKSIGVQSWVTMLTSFLGVLAKLFICLTETSDDIYLVIGNGVAVALNGTLLLQSIIYPSMKLDSNNKDKND